MDTVGVIGVGKMGSGLVARLLLAGVRPVVYDVDAGAMERAQAAGALPVGSPAAVAREAKIIDVVVATDDQTLECTLGADGVLAAVQPGTLLLLHGTILPETTRHVAQMAAVHHDVDVVDACMHGRPSAVRRGEVLFLVGG